MIIVPLRNTVLAQLLVLMGYLLLFSFSTATDEEGVSLSSCSVSADSGRIGQCGQLDETTFFTARFGIPRNEGKCWYAWAISYAASSDWSGGWTESTAVYALDRSNLTLADDDDTLTLADPNCTDAFCEAIIRSGGVSFVTTGSFPIQHRFRSYFVPEGEEEPLDFGSDPFQRLSEDQRGELPFGTLKVTDDGCTYSGHSGVDRSWSVVAAVVNIVVAVLTTTTM
jgi:hypothetical protein